VSALYKEVINLPYVTLEQIDRAKQMDLLTYLQTYEPQELVRFSGNVFTTRSHDSLKISNGKWCWWSRGIGGRSALDYLIKVRGMTLPEAVMQIDGQAVVMPPIPSKAREAAEPRRLLLPEKNKSNARVIAYLTGRGIHITLIDYCIQTGRLYESRYRLRGPCRLRPAGQSPVRCAPGHVRQPIYGGRQRQRQALLLLHSGKGKIQKAAPV